MQASDFMYRHIVDLLVLVVYSNTTIRVATNI
jgi:hypothetical protein